MSSTNAQFGTTVNCMDGRAIHATHEWMKKEYNLNFIDSLTEPGMNGWLQKMLDEDTKWLARKLEISIKNHGSRHISVVGHDDCAGHPVSYEQHKNDIQKGVALVKKLVEEMNMTEPFIVIGAWAFYENNIWKIEIIS